MYRAGPHGCACSAAVSGARMERIQMSTIAFLMQHHLLTHAVYKSSVLNTA